jgi:hypothetical protein
MYWWNNLQICQNKGFVTKGVPFSSERGNTSVFGHVMACGPYSKDSQVVVSNEKMVGGVSPPL